MEFAPVTGGLCPTSKRWLHPPSTRKRKRMLKTSPGWMVRLKKPPWMDGASWEGGCKVMIEVERLEELAWWETEKAQSLAEEMLDLKDRLRELRVEYRAAS